jgi:hypothetical protein
MLHLQENVAKHGSQVTLSHLMLQRGRPNALSKFLLKFVVHDAIAHSTLMPILVLPRYETTNYYGNPTLHTLDTPHFIWIEKGTVLTPRMFYEKVHKSILYSLTEQKIRDEFDQKMTVEFETQDILKFGPARQTHFECLDFSEQKPITVCALTPC